MLCAPIAGYDPSHGLVNLHLPKSVHHAIVRLELPLAEQIVRRSLTSSMKRGERCSAHLWIGTLCGLLIMLACILRLASASQEFC